MKFNKHVIDIDPAAETNRIVEELRRNIRRMRRFGSVVGISGGVDSSVVLALCVRAFGPQKVVALMLPEKDSESESEQMARHASKGYKAKIVLPQNLLDEDTLNVFSLVVITPGGKEMSKQLPVREFLQIVAASNLKQRTRMSMLYYHAEVNNYAVIGTANKNEHDQGFFVKYGDGGVDIKAIGHLYKTQVYQLSEYLGVPEEIRRRTPTSDTYGAPCNQQEFFFRLPFETMDLLWFAQEHKVPLAEVAQVMGLTEIQVSRAFDDFSRKLRATDYLRMAPVNVT